MGKLRLLELENFKSYAGKTRVGPFDDFTCIIGPNGAGKSNLMDAISFVLGVQSKHLRSSTLKELLYRKDSDAIPSRRAYVKLFYELSEGEMEDQEAGAEIVFMRQISATGVSTYRLNDKDVTFELYEQQLQKIGVLVRARNFLVFQGDIESIASKNPQEITKLLEQISGSDALVSQFEDLEKKKKEVRVASRVRVGGDFVTRLATATTAADFYAVVVISCLCSSLPYCCMW
jgi:structural maintenance of chromosome 1